MIGEYYLAAWSFEFSTDIQVENETVSRHTFAVNFLL